jgi:hypothetical protein
MQDIHSTNGLNQVGLALGILAIICLFILAVRWTRRPETRLRGYAVIGTFGILVFGAVVVIIARI